jgi:hypothetical protein
MTWSMHRTRIVPVRCMQSLRMPPLRSAQQTANCFSEQNFYLSSLPWHVQVIGSDLASLSFLRKLNHVVLKNINIVPNASTLPHPRSHV